MYNSEVIVGDLEGADCGGGGTTFVHGTADADLDLKTGKYTCPEDGVYKFNLNFMYESFHGEDPYHVFNTCICIDAEEDTNNCEVRMSFIHFVSLNFEDTAGIIIALVSALMTLSSTLSGRLILC